MTIQTKTMEIMIDGAKEIIEYRTDLSFGDIQYIKKQTYKAKNPFEVDFDSELYQRLIMEKAIIKAPFKPNDYTAIYKLDGDVVTEIMTVLMDTFPLERYFKPLQKMLKKMEIEEVTPTTD